MKSITKALLAASAITPLLVVPTTSASAATFVLNGLNNITSVGARNGFITAANYWAATLTDNVTVYINVGFAAIPANNNGATILGQTSSVSYSGLSSDIKDLLGLKATSALDAVAVASVQDITVAGGVNFTRPGFVDDTNRLGIELSKAQVLDNNGSVNNLRSIGTGANFKALGYNIGGTNDGTITFNSNVNFDFDPTNGITAGSTDFVGVAIHEFGHALGFTSRADVFDFYACVNGAAGGPGCADAKTFAFDASTTGSIGVLDFFRYSAAGTRNVTPGQEVYFSVDGGLTETYGNSNESTGSYNGDRAQASHWKQPTRSCDSVNYIGIMNPYLCNGQNATVTAQDLAAFDAIGWTLATGARDNAGYRMSTSAISTAFAPVPEPATWLQLILGFGILGTALRANGRRKATFAAA